MLASESVQIIYTALTDLMYNTVYTVQYVQISCTTQYTLYIMYRSHVQNSIHRTVCTDLMYNTVYTIQYVQILCTTQHTLFGMYRSYVQHTIHCTVHTDHGCWLQRNCWGQTTVFQKPLFAVSNENQRRHVLLYIQFVCL